MHWVVENNYNNYIQLNDSETCKPKKEFGEQEMESTLDRYYTYLEVNHKKPRTQLQYKRSARYFIDFIGKQPSEIVKDDVMKYVAHLNKKYRHNTTVAYIQGMDVFLAYIGKNSLRMPIPKYQDIHRDTITKHEIQKILRYARKNLHTMEYLMLLFVTDLDCRPHEIALSRWDWIKGNKIMFKDCKTGDTYGFLTTELQNTLRRWKKEQHPRSSHIFTNIRSQCKGKPLSPNCWKVRSIIEKVSRKVIGRKLTPQDFRASVMTEEFNTYVNPKIIQRKARHRSFKSTNKYNHVDDKELLNYLDTGTIFNIDNELISKAKPQIPIDKGSCIKNLPKDTLYRDVIEDDDSNSSVSFSISFYCFSDGTGEMQRDFSINSSSIVGISFFIYHLFTPTYLCIPEIPSENNIYVGVRAGELNSRCPDSICFTFLDIGMDLFFSYQEVLVHSGCNDRCYAVGIADKVSPSNIHVPPRTLFELKGFYSSAILNPPSSAINQSKNMGVSHFEE